MLDVHGPVDQWNDSQVTVEVARPVGEVTEDLQEVAGDEEDLTGARIKVATTSSPRDDHAPHAPAGDSTSVADPPHVQMTPGRSDVASVRSLPIAHVSTSHHSQPSSTRSAVFPESLSVQSETSGQVSATDTRQKDRQNRHRPFNEPARPTNRLSGFFSHLIHRRDNVTPAQSRPLHEQRSTTPVQTPSVPNSRASSPAVPTRPTTPPPLLPPPTLHELGLSLAAVTTTLSPSHFSTPPTSGAFLAPHYLLLCHAQGLDVLPLVSPPALQPYALVRKVPFKSVVVMEQRGVLVAIGGRRDGVRVYALEEVKKAIEWRIDGEIRRERERTRREEIKKTGTSGSTLERRESVGKKGKRSMSTPPTTDMQRKDAYPSKPSPAFSSVLPKKPRPPTSQLLSPRPAGQPPPYATIPNGRPPTGCHRSAVPVSVPRSRTSSTSLVVVPPIPPQIPGSSNAEFADIEAKLSDWQSVSDDEAIDMLTAGASGSQALDERTSSIPPRIEDHNNDGGGASAALPIRTHPVQSTRRPSLQNSPSIRHPPTDVPMDGNVRRDTLDADGDEDDDDDMASVPAECITLAQALLESRLPDLPPVGTLQPQEPILITHSNTGLANDSNGSIAYEPTNTRIHRFASRADRRRRWSTLGGIFSGVSPEDSEHPAGSDGRFVPPLSSDIPEEEPRPLTRSHTYSRPSTAPTSIAPRPSTSGGGRPSLSDLIPPVPSTHSVPPPPSHSRIFPRIFSNAFSTRRNGDRPAIALKNSDADSKRNNAQTPTAPHAPPPKLEYVKLPGTKGALMIKAVETQKKSFLAILCGENGEKVELFAGTYRTALGLSRTFILPDSPKSLELQLQGDDLVEVFLMFSQNVFGLEPATVRVREVRIGRAERRAARRRVREIRSGQNDVFDTDPPVVEEEEANVNINIGITVPANQGLTTRSNSHTQLHDLVPNPSGNAQETALAHAEELMAIASTQVGPYTTFQQLSFAPKFPLATIADDYIIPPTYADFLGYRAEHEPENVDLSTIQFNPPGLPMPAPAPPSRWFYRDPKGIVHGPWKATLMQAWYKDGLLPPDLPVRKEEEEDFILLKDLRQQCVDPVHPFRSAPPSLPAQSNPLLPESSKPLLSPISLLVQPRHFGPPALFYSSRGGHSTSIVDVRGRAVLKGRFVWSPDGVNGSRPFQQRMGDVKRLETFDVKDRSVIVALRQGGLEAMDFGDGLLKPADESRHLLPNFCPPPSNTNRRMPFVWKIGMPIAPGNSEPATLSTKTKACHLVKKASYPAGKSPARSEFSSSGDGESDITDELLFFGRNGDNLYLCERSSGTFRVLKLGPEDAS
ncbi:hypothetical protein ID866_616 [Astraeus odoratus]|nr:hypothetical protein ID866_616 [Astraeus odoratus]